MATAMAEIVYGTKEEGHVMSEKVSQLAASVYSEFERMIKRYDEDVVKELMPLLVGILEALDQSYREKSESEVDQELLRDDNEQLLTQYEREKQLRKAADQKYLEMEDAIEEERKTLTEKLESLESIVRMLELKNKNSSDHLSRMEEKEAELKKEYNKIHERYTELMRTHMDYMERAKILIGTDRISDMANSPRSRGMFQLPNLKSVNMMNMSGKDMMRSTSPPDASSFDMMSPRSGKDSNVSIRSELSDIDSPDVNSNPPRTNVMVTSDKEQNTDRVDVREFATGTKTKDEKVSDPAVHPDTNINSSTTTDTQGSSSSVEPGTVNPTSDTSSETVPVILEPSKEGGVSNTIPSKKDNEPVTEVKSEPSPSNSQETQGDIALSETVPVTPEPTVIEPKEVDANVENVDTVNAVRTSEKQVEKTIDRAESNIAPKTSSLKKKKKTKQVPKPLSPSSPTSPGHGLQFDQLEFTYDEEELSGLDQTLAHIVATTPELEAMEESIESNGSANNNRESKRNDTSIFDELNIQDADLVSDFGITGKAVNPADYASSDSEDEQELNSNVSDNFFGMGRELENLILENTELLATKNALNIVKDDLIAKVDELSGEQEILREEINSLQAVKTKLQQRIKELEDEMKKMKEDMEKKNQSAQEQETEDDVPMAQRKRFTRVEMARVLMERNQYKERLMELQEAVRWTEMIRASREHPEITPSKKKSSIWNFFSNLVAPDPAPEPTSTRRKGVSQTQVI